MADKTEKKIEYNDPDEAQAMSIYNAYKQEGEQARFGRMQQNKTNFDSYHLRQDYSYKQKGQSQEFLPKLAMAVEQGANFLQQGLVDMGEWFRVYPAPGLTEDNMKIKPDEIQTILSRQLEKAGFMGQVGDAVKLGFLGSLMVAKIHGKMVPKAMYSVETKSEGGSFKKRLVKKEDKKWHLVIDLIRQQDWKPDPTASKGMFNIQDCPMDWYALEAMAKQDKGYDMGKIEMLKGMPSYVTPNLQEYERSRETDQNLATRNYRHRVKVTEVWGDFVTPEGDLVWENSYMVIANDLWVIRKPAPIGFWHGEHPYVATPILRVPHSVWGKTPMDAASMLNKATNEMFNLMLDGGLASVHGIKQIREHWLEDPEQVENGIAPGDTLRVNTSCPPGATALERVDTTSISADVLPMYNVLTQEFVTAAMTNDLRMGVQPQGQTSATAIVESNQTNNTMFTAIAKHIEADFVKPILVKAWLTCAQHMNDFDDKELEALIGADRAAAIKQMGPEALFAETAGQIKFEVFGITETLNKEKDFTKLTALLQTISSSPVMMEEFTKKYDFGKLLTEIFKSRDIPMYKLMNDEVLKNNQTGQVQPPGNPAQPGQAPQVPNAQSQIPQAGAAVNQGSSPFPQPQLPGSIASRAQGA